ncbi:nucleotidyl transferase AbiEii/AbiGii toxin family protein [Natronosporangium hydrolyticum]|uniref:Nucleotidyl transferase AbiEii/AbiGii toxin family protein n=1 Tax=Natronosporangium hydrolyticum TaxID=2811111 RepID=A0A895YG54_9ACTN|nr:nucleotidyl transferase AbiEii/AbiGii toxin family protein [Natronosporangium hydrolyticum]QSB16854.1 nucleotidyl transferase AbiEii/AbiGii toxin family protein [Natronosporangium hydrolyticum]
MEAFQEWLARIALDAVGDRGFVLGGGHAVQLHGMASRPSEDIDLFSSDRGRPAEVEADVVAAFRSHQLSVDVTRRTSDLVQMMVCGPEGEICKVDLGIFWRAREPVVLDVGPVLHPDDAAAGKMDALFNRWAPRDFLDVYAIHLSGRYDRRQLEAVLVEHNPGFERAMFAESLGFLTRIPDREFEAYGVDKEHIAAMRIYFVGWQHELSR